MRGWIFFGWKRGRYSIEARLALIGLVGMTRISRSEAIALLIYAYSSPRLGSRRTVDNKFIIFF